MTTETKAFKLIKLDDDELLFFDNLLGYLLVGDKFQLGCFHSINLNCQNCDMITDQQSLRLADRECFVDYFDKERATYVILSLFKHNNYETKIKLSKKDWS